MPPPKLVPVSIMDPLAIPQVVVVGVGGTGSLVLKDLCRLLWGLREQREQAGARAPIRGWGTAWQPGHAPRGPVPEILLIDGDSVERKNIVRQDFVEGDVRKNKALVLAERCVAAYGLPVSAYPRYLEGEADVVRLVDEGAVVVGCVDNAPTRALLHEALSGYADVVYTDSGNGGVDTSVPEHAQRDAGYSGQVITGARKGDRAVLPFPADEMPDLVQAEGASDVLPTEIPCGHTVASQPQRFVTNRRAAAVALEHLTPLLSDGQILHAKTFFDARRGYTKSYDALAHLDEVSA